MAKQIIITQGNTGIGIYNTFLNDDNTIKNLTGYDCTIDIVYPDDTSENIPVEMIDSVNGKVLFMLGKEQTEQVGLHKIYFNISDSNSYITAKDAIFYYVIDDKGGA